MVFDLYKRQSFLNLDDWIAEVEKHGKTDVEIAVIANKVDVMEEGILEPEVSQEEIKEFEKRTGLSVFMASAKTGKNVEATFLKLTETLINKTAPNSHLHGDAAYKHPSQGGGGHALFDKNPAKSSY